MIVSYSSCFVFEKNGIVKILILFICTGTRIRTQIKGFGDLYSTIELCPFFKKQSTRMYIQVLCYILG